MTHLERTTSSPEATEQLGRQLGAALPERVIVTLAGPLGSGKTTLIRGLVASRSADRVSSPTYVYHQRYQTAGQPIDHVDLYRVTTDSTLRPRTGIDELVAQAPGWLLIEWPLPDLAYPADALRLHVDASGGPDYTFRVTASWPLVLAPAEERP